MYFACSPPNRDALSSELIASFQRVSLACGGLPQLYAIVDAGFESSLARWARSHGVSVGEKSSLASIKNHLPFVIPLCEATSEREVSRLIGAAKASPMISFVASRSDATKLVWALQALLVAHTDDGMRWPLRLADTRVLPVFLGELARAESRHVLTTDIHAWWWPRRDGQLDAFLNPTASTSPDPAIQKLELSDRQFARMMNAAQPDSVIARLHQACPDILDLYAPYENHGRVSVALELLASKGFDSAKLQLRWAALALSFRQNLEDIPELVAALAEAPSDEDLLARIDLLPDEVWAAQDLTT